MPRGLPVRPTTDFAKEGLFNILANRLDMEGLQVLDLFSGTGHIALEFASRGASVVAVDKYMKCVGFLRHTAAELGLPVNAMRADVFEFLAGDQHRFDLIFADPPYDLATIPDIHRLVMERKLINPGGLLIIEHGPRTNLSGLAQFMQHRKYGNVNFSFFTAPAD